MSWPISADRPTKEATPEGEAWSRPATSGKSLRDGVSPRSTAWNGGVTPYEVTAPLVDNGRRGPKRKGVEVGMRRSIVGAVSAFLALPAIAGAHGGNDDPNAVHACIRNRSQVVRIVGVSSSCISSPAWKAETPAHWGIQGPPGTNGTNGIDGTSVTFVGYFSENQNGCPNGGAIFAAGSVNAYVCNGQDAATGETRPDGKPERWRLRADGQVFSRRLAVAHEERVERDDRARRRPGLHL